MQLFKFTEVSDNGWKKEMLTWKDKDKKEIQSRDKGTLLAAIYAIKSKLEKSRLDLREETQSDISNLLRVFRLILLRADS